MTSVFSSNQALVLIERLKDGTKSAKLKWTPVASGLERFRLEWGSFVYEVASVDNDGFAPFVLMVYGRGEFGNMPVEQIFSHDIDPEGGFRVDTEFSDALDSLFKAVRTTTLRLDSAVEAALSELLEEGDPSDPPF